MTPEECLVIYGRAWFERDHAKRVELLRQSCTEDILFVDPAMGRLHGLSAVSDMIGHYLGEMAGEAGPSATSRGSERGRSGGNVSVDVVTPIDSMHGFFRYSFKWNFPGSSGLGGTDFCEVAEDGRMKLITVWPATNNFPLPAP